MTATCFIRRSEDGGRTWDAASVLVRGADYGAGPVHNCNTLVDAEHGVLPRDVLHGLRARLPHGLA